MNCSSSWEQRKICEKLGWWIVLKFSMKWRWRKEWEWEKKEEEKRKRFDSTEDSFFCFSLSWSEEKNKKIEENVGAVEKKYKIAWREQQTTRMAREGGQCSYTKRSCCQKKKKKTDKWQIHDYCIYRKNKNHLDRKKHFFEYPILFFESEKKIAYWYQVGVVLYVQECITSNCSESVSQIILYEKHEQPLFFISGLK